MQIETLFQMRQDVFQDMVLLYENAVREGEPIADALESLAALRHLHEVIHREIANARRNADLRRMKNLIKDALEKMAEVEVNLPADAMLLSEAMCSLQSALVLEVPR